MTNTKKTTMKEKRASALYTSALILHGNGKLLDYVDENGNAFKYAQVNTRAIIDCPFRSAGCEIVCYATKGNHVFPDVKASRERSYNETRRTDFADAMIYTIETEKDSKRYSNATMLIRIHESGDFYSVQYLKKWVKIWAHFDGNNTINFIFYTKSFVFFTMLSEQEKDVIRKGQQDGRIAISASLDDTTTQEQIEAYLCMKKDFPLTNTYYCTENVKTVTYDNLCDCANCAKCGTCNKATGKRTVVAIHSASNDDMKEYHEKRRA